MTAASAERRRYGRICLWAGIVGAVQAVVLAVAPAQVDDDRFSYPFDATGFAVAQVSFFVQHLGLLVGLVALGRLPAARAHRPTRVALQAASLGMLLLAVMELVAIVPADDHATSGLAQLVNGLYSVPVLLLGVGLVAGGIGLARRTPERGWTRWIPTATGVWVFVPLAPALMAGFLAGRAGIGAWMLLFALLGWDLSRERADDAGPPAPSPAPDPPRDAVPA